MMEESTLVLLEKQLLHSFKNPILLQEALTHPSSVIDQKKSPSYERLEFLGDAVLQLVITEYLLSAYPKEPEGHLAKRRAALVCGKMLAEIARFIGLGPYIIMSESEEAHAGRDNDTNLEDCLEAILGALYLDSGLEAVRHLVRHYWARYSDTMITPPKDAKSMLQEWVQSQAKPLPAYSLVSQTGPAHAPTFIIQLEVSGYLPLQASANSKRMAEQEVARAFIATYAEHLLLGT